MKYVVISKSDYGDFVETIEKLLDVGWKLQGGVSVRNQDDHWVYYQALVKE